MDFMIKRQATFFIISVLISSQVFAISVWKCIAKNKEGAAWYHYNSNKDRALAGAKKFCDEFNNSNTCDVSCYSPKVYWRCVAFDTRGRLKRSSWYWMGDNKDDAIVGALKACEFNSLYGGCYVKQESCASS